MGGFKCNAVDHSWYGQTVAGNGIEATVNGHERYVWAQSMSLVTIGPADLRGAPEPAGTRMRFASNIEWHFSDVTPDFARRIVLAHQVGFDLVEFHMWRDKDLGAIRRSLEDNGVGVSSMVVDPRIDVTRPETHAEFARAVADSLSTARFLGADSLVAFAGMLRAEASPEEQFDQLVAAVAAVVPRVEDSGVTLLLEPVNSRIDHAGVFLDTTPKGLDAVEAIASPSVRLLYDKYHSDAMGEDMLEVIGERGDLIHYVQVADSGGRAEPGSGSIDWGEFAEDLRTIGFQGPIGLEYHPSASTVESYAAARAALSHID